MVQQKIRSKPAACYINSRQSKLAINEKSKVWMPIGPPYANNKTCPIPCETMWVGSSESDN